QFVVATRPCSEKPLLFCDAKDRFRSPIDSRLRLAREQGHTCAWRCDSPMQGHLLGCKSIGRVGLFGKLEMTRVTLDPYQMHTKTCTPRSHTGVVEPA